jgi:hypothetical protein
MSSLLSSSTRLSSSTSGGNKNQGNIKPRGSAVCTLSNELVLLAGQKTPELEVFVTDGDRTEKKGRAKKMWTAWSEEWDGVPHNLYMFYGPLRVPTEGVKRDEPVTYTRLECARAMIEHAIAKSWIWRGLSKGATIKDNIESFVDDQGNPDKAARKAYAKVVVWPGRTAEVSPAISDEELEAFVAMCDSFTIWCLKGSEKEDGPSGVPHLLTEMVMGSIKEGSDARTTAVDEAFEEACIDKTFARLNLQDKGLVEYTSRGRSSCTAAFLLQIPKEKMAKWLLGEEPKRKEESNWFCAHAWYAYLPGIHEAGMEKVKERHETQNRRWVSLKDARQLLDAKNLGILKHVLNNINIK